MYEFQQNLLEAPVQYLKLEYPCRGNYEANISIERNLTKLNRKQEQNVLYQVWVILVDRKTKMASLDCLAEKILIDLFIWLCNVNRIYK